MLYSKFTYSKNISVLLLILIFSQFNISAQVGIGTTSPQQKIHVAGKTSTIRVEGLNATNNINNTGLTESLLYVDSNGNLTVKPQYPLGLVSITGSDFISTPSEIITTTGDTVIKTISSGSFTTTKDGYIRVDYGTGVTDLTMPDLSNIVDGAPRVIALALFIEGNYVSATSQIYSNHTGFTGGDIANGIIPLNNTNLIKTTAGTHTYTIKGMVFGKDYPFKAVFGTSSNIDSFSVIEY